MKNGFPSNSIMQEKWEEGNFYKGIKNVINEEYHLKLRVKKVGF